MPHRQHFGLHLTLDLYGCDKAVNCVESCYTVLEGLVDELGMHPIGPPHVARLPDQGEDQRDFGGLSGFIMIKESHISIHTFDHHDFITMDIYSCRDFDIKKVIAYINKMFHPEHVEQNEIIRGTEFHKRSRIYSRAKQAG